MIVEKAAGAIIFYISKSKDFDDSQKSLISEVKEGEPLFLMLEYDTYWGFVRGQIEKEETIEETIRRETKEEANLSDIRILKGFKETQQWFYKLKGELRRKFAVYLLAEINEEEAQKVRISFEHKSFKFVKIDEALSLMRIKNEKKMLEKAAKFIKERSKQKTLF